MHPELLVRKRIWLMTLVLTGLFLLAAADCFPGLPRPSRTRRPMSRSMACRVKRPRPFILVRPSVQKSFIWQKNMEKDFCG